MIEVSPSPSPKTTGLPVFLAGLTLGAAVALVLGHDESKKMIEKVIDRLKDGVDEIIEKEEQKAEGHPEPITFRSPGLGPIWRLDEK